VPVARLAVAVAVVLALVPSAVGAPVPGRAFFPLRAGNAWTFENARYGGADTLSVASARSGRFRLSGFPGAPNLLVRWSGPTLQAWDAGDRRWEALLRLGARAGMAYPVDLPQPLWDGVTVTVASRLATVFNPVQRRSYSGVRRLAVRPNPELADAGLTGLWFAPRVGPIRWVEESIAGPVRHELTSARLRR
jgi:hypothetical protein